MLTGLCCCNILPSLYAQIFVVNIYCHSAGEKQCVIARIIKIDVGQCIVTLHRFYIYNDLPYPFAARTHDLRPPSQQQKHPTPRCIKGCRGLRYSIRRPLYSSV